jgi:hypothetical protein
MCNAGCVGIFYQIPTSRSLNIIQSLFLQRKKQGGASGAKRWSINRKRLAQNQIKLLQRSLKMVYINNSFSLQMQGDNVCISQPASIDAAKLALTPIMENDEWGFPAKSIIGHYDICSIINGSLGLQGSQQYEMHRESVLLKPGDVLWVGQYIGQRMPEGCKALPEGAKIKWYYIKCFDPHQCAI